MFVYLSKVFVVSQQIVAIEIVSFSNTTDIKFLVVYKEEFPKLRDILENADADFGIDDDGDVTCNHPVRVFHSPSIQAIPAVKERGVDTILSFYDLLKALIRSNASYLPKKVFNYKGYLTNFCNLRISQSTMTVGLSVYQEDTGRWQTHNLINVQPDGRLSQNAFYCFIPEEAVNNFKIFNLMYLGPGEMNNVKGVVAYYQGNLPLCDTGDSAAFCEPLIAHYGYISFVYKNICKALTTAIKNLFPKEEPSSSFTDGVYEKTCRKGIFYNYSDQQLSNKSIQHCYEFVMDTYQRYYENNVELTSAKLYEEFFKTNVSKLSFICADAIRQCLVGYVRSYDCLSNLENLLKEYKACKLEADLFLYNSRICCIFNPKILKINYNGLYEFPVQGSAYDSTVIVKRRD